MKKGVKIIALTLVLLLSGLGIRQATLPTFVKAEEEETVAFAAVLKQGSRGEVVKTVQTKLKRWGYYKGSVDGIYGKQTKNAVIYFQRRNNLTPDGIVGKKTLAAMGISTSLLNGTSNKPSNGGSSYSNADVKLLARLVYGEARGESYTGQVAVAAVVLNRVKSSSFPNTISGVIYQPYAFTAVADGQINMTPDQSAYKAAQDAMNGWDPSGGAIYYYNPKIATSSWIYSRKVITTIGNHVFAV